MMAGAFAIAVSTSRMNPSAELVMVFTPPISITLTGSGSSGSEAIGAATGAAATGSRDCICCAASMAPLMCVIVLANCCCGVSTGGGGSATRRLRWPRKAHLRCGHKHRAAVWLHQQDVALWRTERRRRSGHRRYAAVAGACGCASVLSPASCAAISLSCFCSCMTVAMSGPCGAAMAGGGAGGVTGCPWYGYCCC